MLRNQEPVLALVWPSLAARPQRRRISFDFVRRRMQPIN
jgi:hypothetical protein